MNLHFYAWIPKIPATLEPSTQAPVVLFLHGMGGTGQIWRPIAAALEDTYQCVAPDQRGHGQGQDVPAAESAQWRAVDYARDVLDLIQQQGWKQILVVGHSMGARTALALGHLAIEQLGSEQLASELIRKVVCVDISLKGSWGGGMGKPLADFMEALPDEFADRKTLRDYLTSQCPDPSIAQYLAAVAKNQASAGTPERWTFPFNHESVIASIHQANVEPQNELPVWALEMVNANIPVTCLRGESSRVWLKADYERQRAELVHPLLQFQEWPNCGHGLPFEQRARFIQFIRDLMEGPL